MSKVLRPQPGPQEAFLASSADIVIYGGAAGGGKAQPLTEPVLTPFGFRPMSEIKVGSKVIGRNGSSATVIQEHYQGKKKVYSVRFIDGAETRCSEDHLWTIKIARSKKGWRVHETSEIIKLIESGKNVLVPLADPVKLTKPNRNPGKIKPYTLGVLIGDGCLVANPPSITSADPDVVYEVVCEGYEVIKRPRGSRGKAETYAMVEFREERAWLKEQGLLCKSEKKFIPQSYKTAPLNDRMALLQGLMDTDGYSDERGHIEYSTTSQSLAKDIQEIVWSIGGKATISEKEAHYTNGGKRMPAKNVYILYIQTKDNSQLFRLKRKKERSEGKKYNGGASELCRRIKSITPAGEEECKCITIDEPDGLYVTKDYIVTHNSYGLLLEPLRHIDNGRFGAVIFRKNGNQIFAEGGLWDTSEEMYLELGAEPRKTPVPSWTFESGMKVTFAHMDKDKDRHKWQGSQIALIGFDELTHFTKKQFFYMLSRNRSTCGVRPYVRATCNPDANSWVREFIDWWIDEKTGYPVSERAGKVRYMGRIGETILWGDSKKEVVQASLGELRPEDVKTVTFIPSKVTDNRILMQNDPGYVANLKALTTVERERLLYGNWNIKPAAGMYFKRQTCGLLEKIPDDVIKWVRAWDLAATEDRKNQDDIGPARTAGVLMGKRRCGRYIVADVINQPLNAGQVRRTVLNTAILDKVKYKKVRIRMNQDPGQAGKDQAEQYIKMLQGFSVHIERESGDKVTRFEPFSAQALGLDNGEKGNVDILIAPWNEEYFNQLESFPEKKLKDMADATATAFLELEKMPKSSPIPDSIARADKKSPITT